MGSFNGPKKGQPTYPEHLGGSRVHTGLTTDNNNVRQKTPQQHSGCHPILFLSDAIPTEPSLIFEIDRIPSFRSPDKLMDQRPRLIEAAVSLSNR